ncbi:MAG: hypothetical protein C4548_05945 [Desulfobacteraceae bacterium]|nr:MAG: hypothetical protein C4548_05945 [Desulfobacteraceae bacterium]
MKNKTILFAGFLIVACLAALVIASQLLLKDDSTGPGGDFIGKTQPETSISSKGEPLAASPGPGRAEEEPDVPDADLAAENRDEPRPSVPEPIFSPQVLTDEQRAENRREIALMKEALPGNMWIPEEPVPGSGAEQGEKLRKTIELGDRIRKGVATRAEKIEYYQFQIRSNRDKIDLIRYIAARTTELADAGGDAYLSESDLRAGERQIIEMENKLAEYERDLAEAENLPAE